MTGTDVVVHIPPEAGAALRELVFDAVADAVHDVEPVDRDGWDIDVSAGPSPRDDRKRNHDRIVVMRGLGGWRWRLVSSNGRILAHSEAYQKRAWCVRMAERVAGGRVRVVIMAEDAA